MNFSLSLRLNSKNFPGCSINPFRAIVFNLDLLQTSANQKFSGVFITWEHLPEIEGFKVLKLENQSYT